MTRELRHNNALFYVRYSVDLKELEMVLNVQ